MKVIKVGPGAIAKNQGKAMANEIFRTTPILQQNPYEVQRPVLIRATYRCSPKQKWSTLDIETAQTKDKWSKWITDNDELKDVVHTKCGEETSLERKYRVLNEEKIKNQRRIAEDESEVKRQAKMRRFTTYDNGTVLDKTTNLMWAAEDNGRPINWVDAKFYCENYRAGGYSDWRMPILDELEGLFDREKWNNRGWKSDGYYIIDSIKINHGKVWASSRKDFGAAVKYFNMSGSDVGTYAYPERDNAVVLPIRSTGSSFDDWIKSGGKNYEKGNYEKAISDYSKAIDLEPYESLSYFNRGLCYEMLGKYSEAIRDFNKAIEINPNRVSAYAARGSVYAKLGKNNEAIRDFNKAIELNPKDAESHYWSGVIYNRIGKYSDAIIDFNKVIALDPNHVSAYAARGSVYAKLGKNNEAIRDHNKAMELANKAIELNPQDAGKYYGRACVLSLMGDELKACKYLQDAIEKGFKAWEHIKSDSDFDNIRNSACYREIMAGK